MKNSFIRLGNKLINLDHVTHIAKEKGENGYYYAVYVAGKDTPEWVFPESEAGGNALRQWFKDMNYPLGYEQEALATA